MKATIKISSDSICPQSVQDLILIKSKNQQIMSETITIGIIGVGRIRRVYQEYLLQWILLVYFFIQCYA